MRTKMEGGKTLSNWLFCDRYISLSLSLSPKIHLNGETLLYAHFLHYAAQRTVKYRLLILIY